MARRVASELPVGLAQDPGIAFGEPRLAGTGMRAAAVAERFFAGESVAALAADYGVSADAVEGAVRWAARREEGR